jgi:hypothetical protein
VWTGNASALLGALDEKVDERVRKAKTWPDGPRALAGRLRRAATFLRKIGVEISFEREGRARTRTIRITVADADPATECGGARPSTPSASSAPTPKASLANDFAALDLRTVGSDADDTTVRADDANAQCGHANPLNISDVDGADGADAKKPTQSTTRKTGPAAWSARL